MINALDTVLNKRVHRTAGKSGFQSIMLFGLFLSKVNVEADDDLGSHFKVTYDNGRVAEVSWSFIRELPVKK